MTVVMEVEGVHKWYKENHAVRGVSFQVERGEIFGIVGPNGAGKTTMVEMLEGIRKRDKGTVRVLGMDPDREPYALRERIGIQFQHTSIQENMKVGEALDLFASFYKQKRNVRHLVASLGLENRLHMRFQELSGGWQQRVTLALATLHEPDILFLDEPSTGLDPHARRELWELIRAFRNEGKTVLLTTHYMEEAEHLCDRVAMFQRGQVIALDTPQALVRRLHQIQHLRVESSDAEPAVLGELPLVERLEALGEGMYALYTRDLQQTACALFLEADRRGWLIEGFRYETGNLDDLFVHLAQQEGA